MRDAFVVPARQVETGNAQPLPAVIPDAYATSATGWPREDYPPPTAEAALPDEQARRGIGARVLGFMNTVKGLKDLPLSLYVKASNLGGEDRRFGRVLEATLPQRNVAARVVLSAGAGAALGMVSYKLFGHDAVSPMLAHGMGHGGGVPMEHATLMAHTQPAHGTGLEVHDHAVSVHPEVLQHHDDNTVSGDFQNLPHGWDKMIASAERAQHAGVLRVIYPEKGNPNYFWYEVLQKDSHGHEVWASDTVSVNKVLAAHSNGQVTFVPEGTRVPGTTPPAAAPQPSHTPSATPSPTEGTHQATPTTPTITPPGHPESGSPAVITGILIGAIGALAAGALAGGAYLVSDWRRTGQVPQGSDDKDGERDSNHERRWKRREGPRPRSADDEPDRGSLAILGLTLNKGGASTEAEHDEATMGPRDRGRYSEAAQKAQGYLADPPDAGSPAPPEQPPPNSEDTGQEAAEAPAPPGAGSIRYAYGSRGSETAQRPPDASGSIPDGMPPESPGAGNRGKRFARLRDAAAEGAAGLGQLVRSYAPWVLTRRRRNDRRQ